MPERPDLEYVVPILDRELRGRTLLVGRAKKPVVLRCALADVVGTVRSVTRMAHAVRIAMDGHDLVVSPMLAGRFQLDGKDTADLAVAWPLDDGRVFRYRDDVQMGKVYWVAPGASIPGLEKVGDDVLGQGFTAARLATIAKGRREQVKVFLMDKSALDAMGNAYADEVLWEARIHPKRLVSQLRPEELGRLHAAIVAVIGGATRTIAERQPPLPEKLRDFLHVRGRKGEPCDRCGTTLRVAGVHGHDAFYCPICQPDVAGRGPVDWRKVKPTG